MARLALRHGRKGARRFLPVQTGCDEHCATASSRQRAGRRAASRSEGHAEAARASRAGFKETILTGVHLGSYGRDPIGSVARRPAAGARQHAGEVGTPQFVGRWTARPPSSISSPDPADLRRTFISPAARERSDAPRDAATLLGPLLPAPGRLIRHRLPDAAIGTDLIVGFPAGRTAISGSASNSWTIRP
jgi:hypothetical protein